MENMNKNTTTSNTDLNINTKNTNTGFKKTGINTDNNNIKNNSTDIKNANINIGTQFLNIEFLRRQFIRPYFLDLGLTVGQGLPRILKALRTVGKPVTQKELADICIMDVTTMSRALDKLEKSGFLTRSINPDCRRSWLINLTDDGIILADKVINIFAMADEIFSKNLTEDEINTLMTLLDKVAVNLNDAINERNNTLN